MQFYRRSFLLYFALTSTLLNSFGQEFKDPFPDQTSNQVNDTIVSNLMKRLWNEDPYGYKWHRITVAESIMTLLNSGNSLWTEQRITSTIEEPFFYEKLNNGHTVFPYEDTYSYIEISKKKENDPDRYRYTYVIHRNPNFGSGCIPNAPIVVIVHFYFDRKGILYKGVISDLTERTTDAEYLYWNKIDSLSRITNKKTQP